MGVVGGDDELGGGGRQEGCGESGDGYVALGLGQAVLC